MSQLNTNQSEELRHERKFLIDDFSAAEVEQLLKFHPACFQEIYHTRVVNNIYFDTFGFTSYYGNLDGDPDRTKVRIRWYGELFGKVLEPTLEYKIKKGLLGRKDFYQLSPFFLNEKFSKQEILLALNSPHVPKKVSDGIRSMNPVLLNSYTRKYFISKDKQFRITIDKDIRYFKISYMNNLFFNKVKDNASVVVELKYHSSLEQDAKRIGNELPFKLTKNSKYLQGVDRILF